MIAAQTAQADYERDNGIVMQDNKTDIDSARLTALATAEDSAAGGSNGLDAQLAELDTQIRQASETLGPNHPQLLALKAKNAASLAALATQAKTPTSPATGVSSRLAAAAATVVQNREKIAKLKMLQSDVDIVQDQYTKTLAREADFKQQASAVDKAVLRCWGPPMFHRSPSFPNRPLIMGGALGVGFVFGILIALLVELLDRRVRSSR